MTHFLIFESTYAGKIVVSRSISFSVLMANLFSNLEMNLAFICTSLPPLKTFARRLNLRLFGSSNVETSAVNTRNSKRSIVRPSSLHPIRASRKRPGPGLVDEESEIDGSYLELVDGKPDQSYNMKTKLVDSNSTFAANSH